MTDDRYFGYSLMAGLFVGVAAGNTMAGLAGGVILGLALSFYQKNLKKNRKKETITQRLQELESLKSKDLITDSEFKLKKEEILKEL